MHKPLAMLVVASLVASLSGCGQGTTQEQRTAQADDSPVISLDTAVAKKRAQRELDKLQQEAKDAMRGVGSRVKSKFQTHGDELSAFAAQMVEEAKDRALDIPEAVDRALDRHTRRWRDQGGDNGASRDRDG